MNLISISSLFHSIFFMKINLKISIASGKGGTGKTTLATALAKLASEKYKTALFDVDVEEPNSALFFSGKSEKVDIVTKLVPRIDTSICNFCGICESVCNFNAILQLRNDFIIYDNLCHSCNACVGLCLKKAITMQPVRIGQMKRYEFDNSFTLVETIMDVGIEQSTPLIHKAVKTAYLEFNDYDFIFFDAPPGTACPTVAATSNMDFVLLVAEPTLFGLHDMKLAVNMLRESNMQFAVVINKFIETFYPMEHYLNSENIEILERFPLDMDVAKQYAVGVNEMHGSSQFRDKLSNILDYLKEKVN